MHFAGGLVTMNPGSLRKRGKTVGQRVVHTLEPVMDGASRVLLLGTMPSPKSRQAGFYYAHPAEPVLAGNGGVVRRGYPVGQGRAAELSSAPPHRSLGCAGLLCHRGGGRRLDPRACPQRYGGNPAHGGDPRRVYHRQRGGAPVRPVLPAGYRAGGDRLPSTSPANCRMSLEALVEAYRPICRYL